MIDDFPRSLSDLIDATHPIVLVGGASRRFGRDKLIEPFHEGMLVEHPIRALRDVFGPRVTLVGDCNPAIPPFAAHHLRDRFPGAGPLGGILTALTHFAAPVFVLAGDMPNVRPEHVRAILNAAAASLPAPTNSSPSTPGPPHPSTAPPANHDLIPRDPPTPLLTTSPHLTSAHPLAVLAMTDRLHPCFGLYLPGALPHLRTRVQRSELRLRDALPADRILPVPLPPTAAANANHPADL